MLSHPHIHFCANVELQRVVQIQEYNRHTKDTPLHPFICVMCVNALNVKPKRLMESLKRRFISVYVLPHKGEGKQIAALWNQ